MIDKLSPIVHFDFDGTLVRVADRKYSRQNARKYPLQPVPGAIKFIEGFKSQGVDLGSIISRRPEMRERITRVSLRDAELQGYFPDSYMDIRLMGQLFPWWKSEANKAQEVVRSAADRVTGMVEDKPHNLGHEMIKIMMAADAEQIFEPVVVGVVDHPDAEKRISKLVDGVRGEFGDTVTVDEENGGIQFSKHSGGSFLLDVVLLDPFSFAAGAGFGERLNDYNI